MSRGEILANKNFLTDATTILGAIGHRLLQEGLTPKFNLSTIMPLTLDKTLVDLFPLITPTLYYSFHSTDADWRKEWMPAAVPHEDALDLLAEHQRVSKKIIKIHGCFIAGENDGIENIRSIIDALGTRSLRCEMNIVDYNPLTQAHGVGASQAMIATIREMFKVHGIPSKFIAAVGRDCGASCGSFYPVHDLTKKRVALSATQG